MLEKYDLIFEEYKNYIESNSQYNARVVPYNTNTTTHFPIITFVRSNNIDLDNNSLKKIDCYEKFYFTIDIYTKNQGSNNLIISAQKIDRELEELTLQFFEMTNFKKTLNKPTMNLDTNIFRRTLQYQCEIGNRGNIIRR